MIYHSTSKTELMVNTYMHGMALTFPMARNPLSKKKTIPKNEKNMPNPVKPNPISVSFHKKIRGTRL